MSFPIIAVAGAVLSGYGVLVDIYDRVRINGSLPILILKNLINMDNT